MYVLRCIKLIWIVPCAWICSIIIRKKTRKERYDILAKWATRLMKAFKVSIQVHQEVSLPKDASILFVGNHQSEFDMLIQMSAINVPFTFISKVENEKTPFVGSWSKTLEVLFFDREDRTSGIHMLREASRRLKDGQNLLIYPEGTRSKGNQMHEMQAGSLQPAFMAKAYIVPVVLENSYRYVDIFKHKGTFHIHIQRPIPFEEYKLLKADGLVTKLQKEMQYILDKSA